MTTRNLVIALVTATLAAGCDGDGGVITPVPEGIALELVAAGLTAPVFLAEAPDGSGRLFVADQAGLIRIIGADGALASEPFLDLRDRIVGLRPGFDERGLLGLAFHSMFATNGRFYVYYSAPLRSGAPGDFDHTSHLSEFRVSGDPDRADPGSERVLLRVDQPQFNHNAGTIAFGPDGMLYISLGDGGGGNDTGTGHVEDWYDENEGGNAQSTGTLLGSILRIDVDGGDPYGIPSDNPFVGTEGHDEIWAFGLRNPYRFSFASGAGVRLLVGDAGQELWEEVSVVERGGNYGWNVKEGTHCFSTSDPETPPSTCPDTDPDGNPLIDPVIEFANSKNSADGLGLVVVGGYEYRGSALPQLAGEYLFGVWSATQGTPAGRVFAATPGGSGPWPFDEMEFSGRPGGLGHYLLGFGEDGDGELYLLTTDEAGPDGSTGRVYRLVAAGG